MTHWREPCFIRHYEELVNFPAAVAPNPIQVSREVSRLGCPPCGAWLIGFKCGAINNVPLTWARLFEQGGTEQQAVVIVPVLQLGAVTLNEPFPPCRWQFKANDRITITLRQPPGSPVALPGNYSLRFIWGFDPSLS